MRRLWRIRLFGRLCVEGDGALIDRFRSQKTAALLAYLALHPYQPHSRDALVDLLWPESSLHCGRHSLSQALSSLRQQLEPPGLEPGSVLVANASTVRLVPEAISTDVQEFESALQAADAAGGDPARVAELLVTAMDLYRGELLSGFFDTWVAAEQDRLAELLFQALERLVALLEASGDLPRAIQYACRAVSVDPLREETHQLLMGLYLKAGRPSAALRQYRRLEQVLDEKLQVRPSSASGALARRALDQASADAEVDESDTLATGASLA